jgi:hypothetical protein
MKNGCIATPTPMVLLLISGCRVWHHPASFDPVLLEQEAAAPTFNSKLSMKMCGLNLNSSLKASPAAFLRKNSTFGDLYFILSRTRVHIS